MIEIYENEFRNLGKAIKEYCGLETTEDFDRMEIESLLSEEGFKKEKDKKTLKDLVTAILNKESGVPMWKLKREFRDKKLCQIVKETKSKGVNILVNALNHMHREYLIYVDGGRIYFTVHGKQKLLDYGLLNKGELSTI